MTSSPADRPPISIRIAGLCAGAQAMLCLIAGALAAMLAIAVVGQSYAGIAWKFSIIAGTIVFTGAAVVGIPMLWLRRRHPHALPALIVGEIITTVPVIVALPKTFGPSGDELGQLPAFIYIALAVVTLTSLALPSARVWTRNRVPASLEHAWKRMTAGTPKPLGLTRVILAAQIPALAVAAVAAFVHIHSSGVHRTNAVDGQYAQLGYSIATIAALGCLALAVITSVRIRSRRGRTVLHIGQVWTVVGAISTGSSIDGHHGHHPAATQLLPWLALSAVLVMVLANLPSSRSWFARRTPVAGHGAYYV